MPASGVSFRAAVSGFSAKNAVRALFLSDAAARSEPHANSACSRCDRRGRDADDSHDAVVRGRDRCRDSAACARGRGAAWPRAHSRASSTSDVCGCERPAGRTAYRLHTSMNSARRCLSAGRGRNRVAGVVTTNLDRKVLTAVAGCVICGGGGTMPPHRWRVTLLPAKLGWRATHSLPRVEPEAGSTPALQRIGALISSGCGVEDGPGQRCNSKSFWPISQISAVPL